MFNPMQSFAAHYDDPNKTLEMFASTLASSNSGEDYVTSLNDNSHENHGGDCNIKIMAGEEDPTEEIPEI